MTLDEYQELAARTLTEDTTQRERLNMCALGLAGESGEVADLIKKHLFHGHPLDPSKVTIEAGDVLWYIATIATANNVKLSDMAKANVAKLMRRYPDGFSSEASINRTE